VDGEILSPADYVLARPLSAYGEAMRGLRTALLLSNVDAPPRAVIVSSSLPGEGKTTTAIALARSVAGSGKRVVLVDADLRRPALTWMLGLSPEAGLVEYLAGEASLDEVLVDDEASGLQVLPALKGAANAPDLLGSDSMRVLVEKLKTDFDLVVVDSPPLLLVSDAVVMARTCDKMIFVIKWEETPRQAADDAVRRLRQLEVDVAGVAFSRVDLARGSAYGGGNYGKGAGYYVN
jgi:capsular exopolysaccharide synthesis family protein